VAPGHDPGCTGHPPTVGCPGCIAFTRPVRLDDTLGISAGRRLTIRNRALIDRGVHPATGTPTDPAHTCGTCHHAVLASNGNRAWWKCDLHRLGLSHSAHSDIRLSWPACTHWTDE
jgi:hypothetical protein